MQEIAPLAREREELRLNKNPFAGLDPFSFGLIMADCPWYFKNYSKKGEGRNATAHYPCMKLEDIKALPVHQLAADDCLLWLWATNPMLPQAFEVMSDWGFTFKTAGTWVKRRKPKPGEKLGKVAFGGGYRLRSGNEPFLIGTYGNPKTSRSVSGVIEAVRREHSRKPDEAYDAAERLVPGVNRLDLFAREERPGWIGWGNETGKFSGEELCK